jgi:hypothetical protein
VRAPVPHRLARAAAALPSPAPARLPRGGWTGLLEIGSEGKEKGEKRKKNKRKGKKNDGKRRKKKRKRKKERGKENRKNELSIFRNYDLQFILTILLLNNKNKI